MSNIIGEAFVRIRPDTKMFAAETKRSLSGAFKGAAAFGGITLGLAGIERVASKSIEKYREMQLVQRQTEAALKAGGASWAQYGDHIENVIQKQSELTTFEDEKLKGSFTLLFRATKDVNKALDLNGLAANVARGRNLDLAKAAQLLVRVQAGQIGSLRRLGIVIRKGASGEEAIAAVRAQYASAAKAYTESDISAQERWNKVLDDTYEIVGAKLSPIITGYQRRLSEWLNKANESGETQRKVNEYFRTGESVVRGFAGGIKLAKTVLSPFVDALGGAERTVKLLTAAFVIGKAVKFAAAVRGVAASFGFIAASSRATTAKVVADAAVAEAALDTAYRPRTVTVFGPGGKRTVTRAATTAAEGAAGGAGANAGKGFFGRLAAKLAPVAAGAATAGVRLGYNPFTAVVVAVLMTNGDSRQAKLAKKSYPRIAALLVKAQRGEPLNDQERAAIATIPSGKSVSQLQPDELARLEAALRKPAKGPVFNFGVGGFVDRAKGITTTVGGTKTKTPKLTGKDVERRIGAFAETQTNAQIAGNVANQRKSLAAEQAFIERALKGAARLTVAERRQTKDTLLSVKQEIQGIDDQIASDAKAADDKAKTKRTAARKAADKAFDARVSTKLTALDLRRRKAAIDNDVKGQLAAISAEETYLKRLISETAKGTARRASLQKRLAVLQAGAAKLTKQAADKRVTDKLADFKRQAREAGLKSTAAETSVWQEEEKWLRKQISQTKKGSEQRKRLQDELLTVREKLKGKTKGGATSIPDLFQAAVDQFRTFGSNIAGRNGVLSPQDARASLGQDLMTRLATASLTEAQKQTAKLDSIDRKLTPKVVATATGVFPRPSRGVPSKPSRSGYNEAAEAAAYGFGRNW